LYVNSSKTGSGGAKTGSQPTCTWWSPTRSKTLHVVTSIKDMAEVEGNCRFSVHVVWTLYPPIEGSVVQTNASFASIFMEAVVYQ